MGVYIPASIDDFEAVTLTIYGEVRSRPLLDKLAVGFVIRERFLRPGWWSRGTDHIPDNTWAAVCFNPFQFTCWSADLDEAHRENLKRMLTARQYDPANYLRCRAVAEYVIKYATDDDVRQLFYVEDPNDFPTHYHHRNLPKPKSWGECKVIPTLFDSVHIFYSGVKGNPKRRR